MEPICLTSQDRASRQCGPLLLQSIAKSGIPGTVPCPPTAGPGELHKGRSGGGVRLFIPGTFHSSYLDQWGSQPRTKAQGNLCLPQEHPLLPGWEPVEPSSIILLLYLLFTVAPLKEVDVEGFGWGWVAVGKR